MKLVCSEELAKLQHGGFQYQFAHLAILRQLPSRVMESMKMTKRDTSEILPCKLSLSSWQSWCCIDKKLYASSFPPFCPELFSFCCLASILDDDARSFQQKRPHSTLWYCLPFFPLKGRHSKDRYIFQHLSNKFPKSNISSFCSLTNSHSRQAWHIIMHIHYSHKECISVMFVKTVHVDVHLKIAPYPNSVASWIWAFF